jgi:hypothetical protein
MIVEGFVSYQIFAKTHGSLNDASIQRELKLFYITLICVNLKIWWEQLDQLKYHVAFYFSIIES